MNVWSRAVAALTLGLTLALGGATLARADEGQPLNINTASAAELTALPGIGPAKAAAIVEQRQQQPFSSVADLTRVQGIGERTLEQLRHRISVGSADGEGGKRGQ
jgi:competence protein ComEA